MLLFRGQVLWWSGSSLGWGCDDAVCLVGCLLDCLLLGLFLGCLSLLNFLDIELPAWTEHDSLPASGDVDSNISDVGSFVALSNIVTNVPVSEV